jgi:hypothetical protein
VSRHLRRWGAAWLIAVWFLASWAAQWVTMTNRGQGHEFWPATLENWQSEALQLTVQAVVLLGMKHWLFKADAEDLERIESKLDRLLDEWDA